MPAIGRKPKPPGQAVNRKATYDFTEVPNVPFSGGPKLPKTRRNGLPWSNGCAQKWAAWSTMPHCVLWSQDDWAFALDSMEIAARFYDNVNASLAAELRNREKVLGSTFDYRRDIRIRYVDPPAETGSAVTKLADYRAL